MRYVTVKNYTRFGEAVAYGGTDREPISPPVHATIHKHKGQVVVSLLTRLQAFELGKDDRIKVGPLSQAVDATYCTKTDNPEESGHSEPEPMHVALAAGKFYCRPCGKARDKRRKALKDQGLDPKVEWKRRLAEQREERVATMTRRHQQQRERSAREHFAVVARNTLFGIQSGVEVNPDGSLTTSTGFPPIGSATPMRAPAAQRRMFALASFTQQCEQHGYTVEQASEFLGVEAERVSWKQYRTAYPRKRQDDEEQEEAA